MLIKKLILMLKFLSLLEKYNADKPNNYNFRNLMDFQEFNFFEHKVSLSL